MLFEEPKIYEACQNHNKSQTPHCALINTPPSLTAQHHWLTTLSLSNFPAIHTMHPHLFDERVTATYARNCRFPSTRCRFPSSNVSSIHSNPLKASDRCNSHFRCGRDFPPVHTGRGAHTASCTMGTWSFPGVKRSGRDIDHPPPHLAPRLMKE